MASNFATLILNTGIAKGENLMRFVTSIKYTAQVAKMVNNITFLYDPNWSYGAYEQATLPCCFYFVRKWEEIGEAEINSKPMMFYNSKGAEGTQRNGAVLDVVADNIINQPKMYRADVLVPFAPDACLDQYQFDNDVQANTLLFSNTYGNKAGEFVEKISGGISVYNRVISNTIGLLRLLFSVLSVDLSVSSIANLILAQNDINKVSLDSMREGRGILKMKMWNGWKFKYVMLKNVDLTKSGEYDGFYEGSITVQETPIINVYQKDQISSVERKGKPFLEKVVSDSKIKKVFENIMGFMEKTVEDF